NQQGHGKHPQLQGYFRLGVVVRTRTAPWIDAVIPDRRQKWPLGAGRAGGSGVLMRNGAGLSHPAPHVSGDSAYDDHALREKTSMFRSAIAAATLLSASVFASSAAWAAACEHPRQMDGFKTCA